MQDYFIGSKEEILQKSKEVLTKEIVEAIEKTKSKEHSDSFLIAILHKLQNTFGFLSEEKLQAVAYLMNIPSSKVYGVATFYHFFKFKKSGRYIISICLGTACHVKGADKVLESIKKCLKIDLGETTEDGLFSLDGTRCLGTCALAPVIKINEKVYPKVSPDQIPKILEKYKKEDK